MVAHSTEERLRQRVDADVLLRLRHLACAHILLLEVPLAHRARDRHHADGVDEAGGPEEHEEVPEAKNHVGRRVLLDGARDERAVRHRVGVLADHRRGVLRYASSEVNGKTDHGTDLAQHLIRVVGDGERGGERQRVRPREEAEECDVDDRHHHRDTTRESAREGLQQDGGNATHHDRRLLHLRHRHVHRVPHRDHHEQKDQRERRHHVRRDLPVPAGAVVGKEVVRHLTLTQRASAHLLDDAVEGDVAPVEHLVARGDDGVEPLVHGEDGRLLEAQERNDDAEQQSNEDGTPDDELGARFEEQLSRERTTQHARGTRSP